MNNGQGREWVTHGQGIEFFSVNLANFTYISIFLTNIQKMPKKRYVRNLQRKFQFETFRERKTKITQLFCTKKKLSSFKASSVYLHKVKPEGRPKIRHRRLKM